MEQTFCRLCQQLRKAPRSDLRNRSLGNGRDFDAPDGALGIAPLSVIGCNSLFDSASQTGFRGTTSYSDSVTWVKGNHTIKFGGDFRYVQLNRRQ